MPLKTKKSLILLLLVLSIPAFSQINTYSPYSRYGLGDLVAPGLAQNSGIGNAGVAVRSSTHINYLNPAAYSALDTMSFVFDFGISADRTNYTDGDNSTMLKNMNIHHIAIGFPVAPWWKAGAGIVPFSNVGYNILEESYLPGYGSVDYSKKGSGGLNKFFLGTSLEFFKKLSVGVNMSYLFGYLDYKSQTSFPFDTYAATTVYDSRLDIKEIVFNFGLQYRETLNDKYFVVLGATFDNETMLSANQVSTQQNFYPGISYVDTSLNLDIPVVLDYSINENEGEIVYPMNLGFGLSFGIKDKILITGEYTTQKWSNSMILGQNDSLANSKSYRGGIEYTPDAEALRGYLNHVSYRLGGYYSDTYLRIQGEQLKDYGITFGVGLPFRGSKTAINLGMVIGQRGKLGNNLIKENYGVINLGITLQDYWFHKRQID